METFSTDNPAIEVYDGETLLARMPLIQGGRKYRIGREMTNDLVIRNDQVSRHHMTVLRRLDDGIIIQDSGSRNGVTVNGRRIDAPHQIRASDAIAIGRLRVRITGLKAAESAGQSSGPAVEPATDAGPVRRGKWLICLTILGMLLVLAAGLILLRAAG